MSHSLLPHGLQYAWLLCPSLSPRVCSNSCPLSQWCHPTISFSVAPLSSCPHSFLASRSFPVRRLFTSGDWSIGASVSASILPVNIQGWFPFGLLGLISLQSKELSSLLQHCSSKASILRHSVFLMVQLSHLCMTTGKTVAFTLWNFASIYLCYLPIYVAFSKWQNYRDNDCWHLRVRREWLWL